MGPLHGPGFRGFIGFIGFIGLWWRLRRSFYMAASQPRVQRVQKVQRGSAPLGREGARLRRRLYKRVVFASLRGAQRARLQREG